MLKHTGMPGIQHIHVTTRLESYTLLMKISPNSYSELIDTLQLPLSELVEQVFNRKCDYPLRVSEVFDL